jgi:Cu-Zn family superoxide dismutase
VQPHSTEHSQEITMKKLAIALAVVLLVVGAIVTAVFAGDRGATHASATLVDAAGKAIGTARLVEDAAGTLHVNVHVEGLTTGLHGVHLHAVGACTPTFAAAGGHHNPLARQHGLDNPQGAHGGDLPNLVVNEAGIGRFAGTTDRATLTAGPKTLFDADGSSIVIHADPDDQVTDPTGNSGARVACGVIQ